MRPNQFHKYSTNFRLEPSQNPKIGSDSCCAGSPKAMQSSRWFPTHSMMHLDRCHRHSCGMGFNCDCHRSVSSSTQTTTELRCIKFAEVCDGTPNCSDESDESNCICSDAQFQCSTCGRGVADCVNPFYCIPRANVGDGRRDCRGKDEEK